MNALPLRHQPQPGSIERRLAHLVMHPWFWVLLVGMIFALPIVRAVRAPTPRPLPDLGPLPAFQLTDQSGKPFGSADLRGKVWVADFIFTRCPSICPLLTQKMQQIQHRALNAESDFHLVSFSVDPTYDTPAVLAGYARAHRANPRMWTFLTGPLDAVKKTVVDGFKISMGKDPGGSAEDDFLNIFHGTHLVLVDARGHIRGYYDSSTKEGIDRLMRAVGLVLNRGY